MLFYLQFKFAIGLLEKYDLDVVTKELDGVSTNWYFLGKNIGVDTGKLDSIQRQHSHNHKVCLKEMLKCWLEHYYTTWSTIVAGLKASVDSQLADHLEAKYCFSEFTTTSPERNIYNAKRIAHKVKYAVANQYNTRVSKPN